MIESTGPANKVTGPLVTSDKLRAFRYEPIIRCPRDGRQVLYSEARMNQHLLSTPLFTVEHRVYERHGAGLVERDVIVHPGAVVILPVLDAQHIIMIRNYRYTVERELWELPAGTREKGETPIDTARRELVEETGYRAENIEPLMEFYTSPGILTERMHAFIATDLTAVGQDLEPGEDIVCEIVKLDEARQMLIDGRLSDGKTIAVLARYFLDRLERARG